MVKDLADSIPILLAAIARRTRAISQKPTPLAPVASPPSIKAVKTVVPQSSSTAYQSPPLTPKSVARNPTPPPAKPPTPDVSPDTIPPALLAVLYETVPEAKNIGLDTPLASLGIDSITGIQVAGKCRAAGFKLKSADIINSRTVRDIVKKIAPSASREIQVAKPRKAISDTEYQAIVARFAELGQHIESILPMNPGMKHLITEWQRSGGTKHQSPFPYVLPGNVDTTRLQSAWNLMVKRYPALRSTAASAPGSGEPRLVIFKSDWRAPQFAEEHLDDENFHSRLIDRLSECAHNPLSIDVPAVRIILFRNKSKTLAYLCIHIHHIMYDGYSMHLITKAFSDIYNLWEPVATSDTHGWLSLFPLEERFTAPQEAYWKSYLPTPFRPYLFPRLYTPRDLELSKYVPRHCMSDASVMLKATDCERKARELGTSLNAIFMAVWASVHARYTGTSGATFALWQTARGIVDGLENLITPCVNIVPVHVEETEDILATSRSIREDLANRPVEVQQSDFEDIYRWVDGQGGTIINTTVNLIRIPKFSESTMLLEPVSVCCSVPLN